MKPFRLGVIWILGLAVFTLLIAWLVFQAIGIR
ncbi:hypothetical protein BH10PSE7_BH10PSE7_31350 [soil metagenome]